MNPCIVIVIVNFIFIVSTYRWSLWCRSRRRWWYNAKAYSNVLDLIWCVGDKLDSLAAFSILFCKDMNIMIVGTVGFFAITMKFDDGVLRKKVAKEKLNEEIEKL